MARTDGDTWDPATGVGMTATFGAVARAVATNKGLISDPLAEQLVRAAGLEYFVRLIEDEQFATDSGSNPLMSGMLDVLGAHGKFLDEFLTSAARAGIRQAVNLGAGLDARAFRLWWPPGTTVYEIDQPGVVEFKDRVLRGLGAKLTTHRRALGVDLRGDWLTALQRVGFDPNQRTVWIAENLFLGYLPPETQDRLLHQLTGMSAAGSWLAADHLPWTPLQLQEGEAFIQRWRQEGMDIDLSGLTYSAEFRSVPENLAATGWQVTDRSLLELFAAVGLGGRRRVSDRDVAISPRFVTATLIASGDRNGTG